MPLTHVLIIRCSSPYFSLWFPFTSIRSDVSPIVLRTEAQWYWPLRNPDEERSLQSKQKNPIDISEKHAVISYICKRIYHYKTRQFTHSLTITRSNPLWNLAPTQERFIWLVDDKGSLPSLGIPTFFRKSLFPFQEKLSETNNARNREKLNCIYLRLSSYLPWVWYFEPTITGFRLKLAFAYSQICDSAYLSSEVTEVSFYYLMFIWILLFLSSLMSGARQNFKKVQFLYRANSDSVEFASTLCIISWHCLRKATLWCLRHDLVTFFKLYIFFFK